MATIAIKFGAYEFEDRVESCQYRGEVQIDAANVPKRPGQIITGGKISVREYELRGSIVGTTATDVRDQIDEMFAAIVNVTGNLFLFSDRYIEARLASFTMAYVEGSAMEVVDFSLIFRSTLPFEVSADIETVNLTTTTASNQETTVTNDGNTEAYAVITVTAPSSPAINNDCTITNVTRDESFQYLGIIAVTKSLIVDSTVVPFSVENDGTSDIANFSGQVIKLDPGANTIRINAVVGAALSVAFRHTYK